MLPKNLCLSFLFLAILLCGFCVSAHAQLTDQQKQDLFIQSKKPTTTSSSPLKKKTSTHSSSSSHKKHHSSSTSKKKTAAHHSSKHTSSSSYHGVAPSSDTSHDQIIPIKQGSSATAPITIEKSGLLPDQGLEPTPIPEPPKPRGFGWFFSDHQTSSASYRYLSPSVRRAIDRAWVRRGRWKYIIVHNSGTRVGNARIFDIYHRRVRHMVNGMAYHFVIGNGHDSGDGEIEVGHRWIAQINGGHVASDYLNDISLGICLVGDYNRDVPTKRQIGALNELISYLRLRVGKTQGRPAIVCAHKEINPKPTDCPGSRFPYRWLHQTFGSWR